jgi:hypothetical protein
VVAITDAAEAAAVASTTQLGVRPRNSSSGEVGDEVVVNTTAVDLDLGTGGSHVVHWNLARREWGTAGPHHIMKLRYTGVQIDTGSVEEDHPEAMASFRDLGGRVVVVCGLHSQLAPVVLAVRRARPEARIAYVMTDGAALPLAFSDSVHRLCTDGLLDVTITAGHAFGGDLEAVGIPSALAAAVAVGTADVIVAGSGPGVSAPARSSPALEVAQIVDTCSARRPTGGPRLLGRRHPTPSRRTQRPDESRPRARSHHRGGSRAGRAAADDVRRSLLGLPHRVVEVSGVDAATVLAPMAGLLSTMGRTPDDDPVFFAVAIAAGTFAAVSARGRADTLHW